MWRTDDGVVHTVAVADPEMLFTEAALESLRALVTDPDGSVLDVEPIVLTTIDESARLPYDDDSERPFVAASPEPGIFATVVRTEQALVQSLAALDWRWRLDVVLALQDLADRWQDDGHDEG